MASVLNHRTIVGSIVDVFEPRAVGKEEHTVVNFTVAHSLSYKDGDEWKNGPTEFIRCTVWRKLAENVAETFRKGDRVIVIGRQSIPEGTWKDKDGNEHEHEPNLTADFVGLDLTYDPATSARKAKNLTTAMGGESEEGTSTKKKSKSAPSKGKKSSSTKSKKDEVDNFMDDDDFGLFSESDNDLLDDDLLDDDLPF